MFPGSEIERQPPNLHSLGNNQFATSCELCFSMVFGLRNPKDKPQTCLRLEKTNSQLVANCVFPWISGSEIERQAPNPQSLGKNQFATSNCVFPWISGSEIERASPKPAFAWKNQFELVANCVFPWIFWHGVVFFSIVLISFKQIDDSFFCFFHIFPTNFGRNDGFGGFGQAGWVGSCEVSSRSSLRICAT